MYGECGSATLLKVTQYYIAAPTPPRHTNIFTLLFTPSSILYATVYCRIREKAYCRLSARSHSGADSERTHRQWRTIRLLWKLNSKV